MRFLISVGADINLKDHEMRSLLHASCQWGDIACVKLLIKQGINVNGRDFYGKTPLFECIQSNVDRIEKMRFLISVGADINLKDHDMRSLLHASCQWGDIACVKLLIKEGLGVNDRDDYGQTPLFSCIQSKVDRIEKMRFLISVGADINVKNKDKNSSLHVSCQSGDIACVKILIKEGLGVNDRAVFGQTPLFYCIQSAVDRIEKMQFLISKGADINVKDKKRRSLLHISCNLGDIPCVKWLIKEGGLHVNDRDRYGETPLLFCISSIVDRIICVEITEILIKAGADVNARDRKGQSILHHSVEFGDVKYVKILIEAGAKVKVKDKKGYKPIYYCCKTFFDPVEKVKLLLEAGAKIKFRKKMIKKSFVSDLREFLKTYSQ
ncbi:putative ankyrin repeat protein RF_0381 [Patella vulgata]|uniref:putative ankyrin repeat protein RF_0381 n=1 Tax=Patella vulgata TaxID=6465 RepID=UPI0024A8B5CF|nr:putative ankyrin repeat protein RF_0381 [Patella vulgata]